MGRFLLLLIGSLLVLPGSTLLQEGVSNDMVAKSKPAASTLFAVSPRQRSEAERQAYIQALRAKARPPHKASEIRTARARTSVRRAPYLLQASVANASSYNTADDFIAQVVRDSGATWEHQVVINEALFTAAPYCVPTLKNLYVKYGKTSSRAFAGKSSMMINAKRGNAEIRALVFHEFAHTMQLGCFNKDATYGASEFNDASDKIWNSNRTLDFMRISWIDEYTQKPEASDADFVSGYAATDTYEDFAETFLYFVTQNDAFHLRAQYNLALRRKLNWMQSHFPHLDRNAVATGSNWNGTIPWDITKLGYQWHPIQ